MAKSLFDQMFNGSRYTFFTCDVYRDPSNGAWKVIGRDDAGNLVGLTLDQNYEIVEVAE